jgi:hypothetical protein
MIFACITSNLSFTSGWLLVYFVGSPVQVASLINCTGAKTVGDAIIELVEVTQIRSIKHPHVQGPIEQ